LTKLLLGDGEIRNYAAWLEVLSRFRSYTERVMQAADDNTTAPAGAGARAKKGTPPVKTQAAPALDKRAAEVCYLSKRIVMSLCE
jgi:hypothetical protein